MLFVPCRVLPSSFSKLNSGNPVTHNNSNCGEATNKPIFCKTLATFDLTRPKLVNYTK